jgi:hypothetical protein
MKRFLGFVGAVLAVIPFQTEREDPDCKNSPCAIQPNAAAPPEQPHPLGHRPTYEVRGDIVEIFSSPPYTFERDSEEFRKWLRENGYPPLAS